MLASLRYYVEVLGFQNADWGTDDFTSVNRDGAGIYLCRGGQGQSGTWVWIGVEDVELFMRSTRTAAPRFAIPPRTIRGRWR